MSMPPESIATVEQPPPQPSGHLPVYLAAMQLAHRLDCPSIAFLLTERAQLGLCRYGDHLRPGNGRDALTDLLQELLDAVLYAIQATAEGRLGEENESLAPELILMAERVLKAAERQAGGQRDA